LRWCSSAFAGPGTPTGPLSFGWQLHLPQRSSPQHSTGLVAWAVDSLVFRSLRRRGAHPLTMVFAAFGAALVMRNVVVLLWGTTRILHARIADQRRVAAGRADAARPDLHPRASRHRRRMPAPVPHLQQDPESRCAPMAESPALAQVCGIEVDAVVRWTWILSGALAALAGVFAGLTPQLHPEVGLQSAACAVCRRDPWRNRQSLPAR
jgi:branched-chain amino acid transport system permease protein